MLKCLRVRTGTRSSVNRLDSTHSFRPEIQLNATRDAVWAARDCRDRHDNMLQWARRRWRISDGERARSLVSSLVGGIGGIGRPSVVRRRLVPKSNI